MGRGMWGGALVGGAFGALMAVGGVALLDGADAACAAIRAQGRATHYEIRSGGGNCGYYAPPDDRLYVALGPEEFGKAGACGGYLDVTGPNGKVRVKVVDSCPMCEPGEIDLSRTAFARLAPLTRGIVPVTYTKVIDPPMPALSAGVRKGSNPYWLSLFFIDHGNPLVKVRARAAGRPWQDLVHTDYNAWQAPRGLGPGPFSAEITDDQGHTATLRGIEMEIGAVQPTRVRLYDGAKTTGHPSRSPIETCSSSP